MACSCGLERDAERDPRVGLTTALFLIQINPINQREPMKLARGRACRGCMALYLEVPTKPTEVES